MKKLLCFVVVWLFCLTGTAIAELAPPNLSFNISGTIVAASWTTVPDATGYMLYYAPFPYTGPDTIGSIDMGSSSTISVDLPVGTSFYIAVSSYDSQTQSGYSNIELFNIQGYPPITFAYVQWRSFEENSRNRAAAWISLPENMTSADVESLNLEDPMGDIIAPFWTFHLYDSSPYYTLDCRTETCNFSRVTDTGYSVSLPESIAPGIYKYVVKTTDGTILTKEVSYHGKTTIPVILEATFEASWNADGSLTIQWENPTNQENWNLVDQIRIRVNSRFGDTTFNILLLPIHDSSFTIPVANLQSVFSEDELDTLYISIKTRAYDDAGNYARGYSTSITLDR